jgi:3-deoxy-D-manno-octulosonic-acid transferase
MIIYNFLFITLFLLFLPILALRKKLHRGYLERLGFLPSYNHTQKTIWLHAVSVGEIISSRELIKQLKLEFPDKLLVISTITKAGNNLAKTIAGNEAVVTYLPLDISFLIKRFIRRFNVWVFIAMETEIWPNLFTQLKSANIPILILNGRVSNQSLEKYKFVKSILKPILERVDLFAMQNKDYAQRIIQLGAPEKKVEITGNMKFDNAHYSSKDIIDYKEKLNLKSNSLLWVCGSTHPGEEKIILRAFKQLIKHFPNLELLLAPRHIERVQELEKLISEYGFLPTRISKLGLGRPLAQTRQIFILDTIGQLSQFYSLASVVFIGGSLVKKGGHNILEPANYAKPIVFGPYMHNFSDIKDLFLENDAAIVANDAIELEDSISMIAEAESLLVKNMGIKAKQIVDNNRGATNRNIILIKDVLSSYERLPV